MKAADARCKVPGIDGLDILPATIDLASTEVHLLTRTAREHVLRRALKGLHDEYDMMIIDCPPSLGILAINGLCAADEVRQASADPLAPKPMRKKYAMMPRKRTANSKTIGRIN